jgi:YfiH family protein
VAAIGRWCTDALSGEDFAVDGEPLALAALRDGIAPHPTWTWLRQVHGAEVVTVRVPGEHAGAEADAAVTDAPGATLAVQTADCAPVLLWDAEAGVVGAAHAGWRGAELGVLQATVAAMEALGADRSRLEAHVGACISAGAYEFSQADLTRLAFRYGPDVIGATDDGSAALDLRMVVRSALGEAGVDGGRLTIDQRCTATDRSDGRHTFYSWRARRDTGRQTSVIRLLDAAGAHG